MPVDSFVAWFAQLVCIPAVTHCISGGVYRGRKRAVIAWPECCEHISVIIVSIGF